MAAAFSWYLAVRYLLSRWINVLGMVGVALGVWALIVVVAVFSGFIADIRASLRNAAPDLLLTDLPARSSYAALAPLLEDSEVLATAPRLRQEALYYPLGRGGMNVKRSDPMPMTPLAFEYVELLGVDIAREAQISPVQSWLEDLPADEPARHTASGDDPFEVSPDAYRRTRARLGLSTAAGRMLRTPPGILLGHNRASRLLPAHELALVTAHYVPTDDGGLEPRKVRRIFAQSGGFRTGHRVFDQTKALVDIEQLRTMLGEDEFRADAVDLVTDIGVRARPDADLDALARRLETRLHEATGGEGQVLTWSQQNAMFLGVVDQERGMMKLILFAVVLVSVFLIYATMHMMVTQKFKDIGILSAMGAARRGVRDVFMLCGVVIATIGCFGGALAGWLTATYLDEIDRWFIRGLLSDIATTVMSWFSAEAEPVQLSLFPPTLYALERIPTQVEGTWMLQVTVGAFLLTLLAAWIPARRAARFEPVRALVG